MTVTLNLTPDMTQKLREIAQGRTNDTPAIARELLAQMPPKNKMEESDLLLQINALGLPAPVWQRYDTLLLRRQSETLTEAEHAELLQIANTIETNHVECIRLAAQLARLQNKPLLLLMQEMGIGPRPLPQR